MIGIVFIIIVAIFSIILGVNEFQFLIGIIFAGFVALCGYLANIGEKLTDIRTMLYNEDGDMESMVHNIKCIRRYLSDIYDYIRGENV